MPPSPQLMVPLQTGRKWVTSGGPACSGSRPRVGQCGRQHRRPFVWCFCASGPSQRLYGYDATRPTRKGERLAQGPAANAWPVPGLARLASNAGSFPRRAPAPDLSVRPQRSLGDPLWRRRECTSRSSKDPGPRGRRGQVLRGK